MWQPKVGAGRRLKHPCVLRVVEILAFERGTINYPQPHTVAPEHFGAGIPIPLYAFACTMVGMCARCWPMLISSSQIVYCLDCLISDSKLSLEEKTYSPVLRSWTDEITKWMATGSSAPRLREQSEAHYATLSCVILAIHFSF